MESSKDKSSNVQKEQSPEASFISTYKKSEFNIEEVEQALKKLSNKISQIGYIPQTDVIHNCEKLRTICGAKDSTSIRFFEATLAFGEYLIIINSENQIHNITGGIENEPKRLGNNNDKYIHQICDIIRNSEQYQKDVATELLTQSNKIKKLMQEKKTDDENVVKNLKATLQKINEVQQQDKINEVQKQVKGLIDLAKNNLDKIEQYLENIKLTNQERWINYIKNNDLFFELDAPPPVSLPNDLSKNIFNGKTNSRALFSCLVCAATGLLVSDKPRFSTSDSKQKETWSEWFQTYFNPLAISFLTDIVLVQHSICSSYVFSAFIETVANVYVLMALENGNSCISKFIDNRIIPEHENEFPQYLKLITTISSLIPGSDFAEAFLYQSQMSNSKIIQMSTIFVSEKLFYVYIDLLTSLIKSKDLAIEIFLVIYRSTSVYQIVHFTNFYNAIIGHAKDFTSCEIERHTLAERDALGLQSVMRLYSAFWKFYADDNDPPEYQMFNPKYPQNIQLFIESLFSLICSPIPASLKAECINLLASMPISLWGYLEKTPILTKNSLEAKEGIIADIHKVEAPTHIFNIPQAFAHFLAEQFKNGFIPENEISLYHRFCFEEIFLHLLSFEFIFPDTKWKILKELCDFWISAISANYQKENDRFKICESIFRSAIEKQDFIFQLLKFILDNTIPIEVLHLILKLFLLLGFYEKDFLIYSHQTSRPCTETIVNQISWNSDAISKILIFATSYDKDFQITCLQLIEFLAKASPTIVQIFLTKPEAKAIQVCQRILITNEQEISNNQNNKKTLLYDSSNTNVRCFLLKILINLGASSYFVRHVCGFDQHNPPQSILNSTLEKGILIKLIKMLNKIETHINYPQFVDLSFQLLLLECENSLTINAILKILSESRQSFFISQLHYLQDPRSSSRAIGCLLQILSREALNINDSSYGITIKAFQTLMTSDINIHSDNNYHYVYKSKRSILLQDFVERIINSDDSIWIANGLNDIIIAYFNSSSVLEFMKKSKILWNSNWIALLTQILEKILSLVPFNLNDKNSEMKLSKLTKSLSDSCSIIARFIFNEHIFEKEYNNATNLFNLILRTIIFLSEIKHNLSLIGIYSLLNSFISSLDLNEEEFLNMKEVAYNYQQQIFNSISVDSLSEIPILQSSALSAFESFIQFTDNSYNNIYLNNLIINIDNDWELYKKDIKIACFILDTKCSLFTKYLIEIPNFDHIFIDEGIISRLSNEKFWRFIVDYLYQSSDSVECEHKLKTASIILELFTTISIKLPKSDNLHLQFLSFLRKFKSQIVNILNYSGHLTLPGLKFLVNFTRFISSYPKIYINDLKELHIWDHFPVFFKKFSNESEWKSMFKFDSLEDTNKITSYVQNLFASSVLLFKKMNEFKLLTENKIKLGKDFEFLENYINK